MVNLLLLNLTTDNNLREWLGVENCYILRLLGNYVKNISNNRNIIIDCKTIKNRPQTNISRKCIVFKCADWTKTVFNE